MAEAVGQPGVMPLAKTDRSISDLEVELRAVAEKAGADLTGIADMTPVYATWAAMSGKPVNQADAWPRAISIAVAMNDKIVDGIPKITPEFGNYFYGKAQPAAKKARSAGIGCLKKQGFAAADSSKILPGGGNKIAARYSGLAWIGKSCLAVMPQCGPRVAWEVVFTDAPLTPSARKPPDRECGDCQRCVDVCPDKAYTGVPFGEKDPLAKRYDAGPSLSGAHDCPSDQIMDKKG